MEDGGLRIEDSGGGRAGGGRGGEEEEMGEEQGGGARRETTRWKSMRPACLHYAVVSMLVVVSA